MLENQEQGSNMALVLDVEQILYDIIPSARDVKTEQVKNKTFSMRPGSIAIVAEDSKVARSMLEKGLSGMGIPAELHNTGLEAWEKIKILAQQAQAEGVPIRDKISMVLTDLEMPEMDGFTLTRNIKSDPRLKEIPVVIHSSLSGSANEDHVRKVGANGYVAKFEINELSSVIHKVLEEANVQRTA
jgi:two-component system chemotaxis response regulator CheV